MARPLRDCPFEGEVPQVCINVLILHLVSEDIVVAHLSCFALCKTHDRPRDVVLYNDRVFTISADKNLGLKPPGIAKLYSEKMGGDFGGDGHANPFPPAGPRAALSKNRLRQLF